MKRYFPALLILLLLVIVPSGRSRNGLCVGSKQFTESVILGEILTQLIQSTGIDATQLSVGGTTVVFDALKRGEIDAYPEYTGTLIKEVYANEPNASQQSLPQLLAKAGISMSQPLGFNNSYALAVRRETAEQLKLNTIQDLASHPNLRLGFSNEFLDREDGWKNLRKAYRLPQTQVVGMEHEVAYRQLDAGSIDVIDVYTTDAQLDMFDLVILEDNKQYFPRYDAIVLYRNDLSLRYPEVASRFQELAGSISSREMIEMNAKVARRDASEIRTAADFMESKFSLNLEIKDPPLLQKVWNRTVEHCDLVRRSLIPAILMAIPLGVLAAKLPRLGQVILSAVGIVQTIPALALLVLLIAPVAYLKLDTLGASSMTAIIALFLYSLLPIVRNTAAGISTIAPEYRESALALGLSPWYRLFHIELPLASPSILAGIKTAAVLNVGFATLGALVGARGYGQPILTGIRLNDTSLIMQGAVPAACLAILLQTLFELAERKLVPAGLVPPRSSVDDGLTIN